MRNQGNSRVKSTSNHLEMMESRALLSVAPLHAIALYAHVDGHPETANFVYHEQHEGIEANTRIDYDDNLSDRFRAFDVTESQSPIFMGIIRISYFHLGGVWDGRENLPGSGDVPPTDSSHGPGTDDSGDHVTGRPARAPKP